MLGDLMRLEPNQHLIVDDILCFLGLILVYGIVVVLLVLLSPTNGTVGQINGIVVTV